MRDRGDCRRRRFSRAAGWLSALVLTALAAEASAQNTALSFNGANPGQYVTFGVANGLGTPRFTLEVWFRWTGGGTSVSTGGGGISDFIPLLTKGRGEAEGSNVDANYFLGIKLSTARLAADFEDNVTGGNHPIIGGTAITANVWHHAAATYDGTTWRLYLDGTPDGTLVVNATPRADSIQHAGLATTMNSSGSRAGFYAGVLDEARVWNIARSQAQILSTIGQELPSAPGLIGRWGMNEGSGTLVSDSSGSGVLGTASPTATPPAWVTGAPFSINLPPDAPLLNGPADGATGVGTSPTLDVYVSDPDADDLTVTYYGRAAAASPQPDFTLVVLPDTQFYTSSMNGGSPAIFNSQTQWIVNNRAARNIAYVAHVGDCTEHGDDGLDEWEAADVAMSKLEDQAATQLPEGIPYGIAVGNHDQSPKDVASHDGGSTNLFNLFFGIDRFAGRSYYGGSYAASNNNDFYQLFSAGGMDFIVIYLEFDTSPEAGVLAWADDLLKTYSNRRAIVTSHYIIGSGTNASFSSQGQAIYNALRDNPNLFLMISGHLSEGRRTDTFGGNTVWSLMSDYQGRTAGGSGWLRIMEFSPANDVIRVKTYSPWLGQFETDSSSQFDVPYDMPGGAPFAVVATDAGVPSGSSATMPWAGLDAGTEYEWYVAVSDGQQTVTGPVWRFTTAGQQTFTLNVSKNGTGTGTVTSNPAGISCGQACSASFGSGSVVNLTPGAAAGSIFVGWSGACTGTGACQVTMDAAKSVAATFTSTFTLSVSKNGTGTGTVTSSPAGISCGQACSASFESGSVVSLTPSAAAGSVFAGWSGACTGTGPCQITMNAARSVTAGFNLSSGTPTIFEKRVAASGDDAEQNLSTGVVDLTSSDLELVQEGGLNQAVGIRFTGVSIPQGATIVNAWVQFKADETHTGATSVNIQGQAAGNPLAFTTATNNISSRPKTVSSVSWTPGPWGVVGEAGPVQQTPNLASVIQEIVSRPDWVSANPLVLIITGTGTRTAESFNGDAPGAPLLHVEYSIGGGGNLPPTVSAGVDQTIMLPASANLDATVSDDGVPGPLATTWSKLSGPGTVTFGSVSAVDTTASFSAAGSYTLRLTANDGAVSVSDDVLVTVNGQGGGVVVFEKRVAASGDDAEQNLSTGAVDLTSSDLELVQETANQAVGIRFTGVSIPQGATIVNAWVQFKADETHSGATSVNIQGQAAANPLAFTTATNNISSRPKTVSSVSWTPGPWSVVGEAGPVQQTPNLASVIQEIVSRPDWVSANPLVLIITGTGTRTAESFNGDAPGAPLLHVEYH